MDYKNTTSKRHRDQNWDENERYLLRKLVNNRFDIIEAKDTSGNTNNKKKAAWQEVYAEFSKNNLRSRDLKQLQAQWKKMKIISKKFNQFNGVSSDSGSSGKQQNEVSPDDIDIQQFLEIETIKSESQDDSINDDNTTNDTASLNNIDNFESTQSPDAPSSEKFTPGYMGNKFNNPSYQFNKKKFKMNTYKKQLFELSKEAREKAMFYAEQEHNIKMDILKLEKEYWIKKNKSLQ